MREYMYVIHLNRVEAWSDPTPEEKELTGRHFAYLKGLFERGVVRFAGRIMQPGGMGMIAFVAADDDAAQAMVDGDPAVAAGMFRTELYPFRIALP